MLISWSRDAYGNTTWRIWGVKVTLQRVLALFALAGILSIAGIATKAPASSTYESTTTLQGYQQQHLTPPSNLSCDNHPGTVLRWSGAEWLCYPA